MHDWHSALASKERPGGKKFEIQVCFTTFRSAVPNTSVPLSERLRTCARERTGVFVSKGFVSLLFPLSALLLKCLTLVKNPVSLQVETRGTNMSRTRYLLF